MNNQPLITALRYLVAIAGGVVTTLVAVGTLSKDDADKIMAAVNGISAHSNEIIGLSGILASATATAYGAYKSTHAAQVSRIEQTPGVKLIVTNADTAPRAAVRAADDDERTKVDFSPDAKKETEHA